MTKLGVSYARLGKTVFIYYILLYFALLTILVTWVRLPLVVIPFYSDFLFALIITGIVYLVVSLSIGSNFRTVIERTSQGLGTGEQITAKTSELLVDNFDVDLIRTIREEQGGTGGYFTLVRHVSYFFPVAQLFEHLGKLQALGYLKADRVGVELTVEALDLLSFPPVAFQATVPPNVATRLARMRLALNSGNMNGVLDQANQLLEFILRHAFEQRFAGNVEIQWKNFVGSDIKIDYDHASLRNLAVVSKRAGIIPEEDILYEEALLVAKIRVPQVHERESAPRIEESALTAMRTVEIFVRHWYQLYPERRIW